MLPSLALSIGRYAYYMGLVFVVVSASFIGAGIGGLMLEASGRWEVSGGLMVSLEFILWGLALLAVGVPLSRISRVRGQQPQLNKGSAVVLTVAVWVLVPLISAIPLSIILDIHVVDALFEAVAGWTTTGLTIMVGGESSLGGYVPSVEELPSAVVVWRALIQWLGGIGIVIFTIALLARPGISVAALYLAEGRFERLEASLANSAKKLIMIYLVITIAVWMMFIASGMDAWIALLHSMTAVSTAGFSTFNDSIGRFSGFDNSLIIYSATIIASFLGAMSFVDLDHLLRLRFRRLLASPEFKAQVVIAAAASTLAYLIWSRSPSMREVYTAADAVYNALSAFTTVGYSTASLDSVSYSYLVLLIALSLIGGSAFSTAGGIKVLRLIIVVKVIEIEAKSIIMPKGYVPKRRIGTLTLSEGIVRKSLAVIAAFMLTYMMLILAVFTLYGGLYDPIKLVFEVTSALANIGLSAGVATPEAPLGLKLILIAAMLLGRLEIIPYVITLIYLAMPLRIVRL